MRLITFSTNGSSRIGTHLKNNKVVDLNYAYQAQLKSEGKYRYREMANAYVTETMKAFIQGGAESIQLANQAVEYAIENPETFSHKIIYDISEVKVEAPISNPEKMFCVGHNYREHILEKGMYSKVQDSGVKSSMPLMT